MQFGRLITAMVTPFDHKGNIDYEKTKQLINYLLMNGTEGIVITGTTGESPTLTQEEKVGFIRFVVQYVNKRIPVIAGTGSNNTQASITLTRQAETIGVDGVMVVTPYYNKPSQEGMYQHFKTIAASTTLPVMLYNIPGRSVVNLSVDTIIRLSQITNITAIKEASGDLDRMTTIISETDDHFELYSGDDSLTLPVLSIGGKGVVSVSSHIIGNEMQQMINYHINGEQQQASRLHQQLLPIMKALFMAPNPTAVKEALCMMGIDVGSVRLPLIPLSTEERSELTETLQLTKQQKVV
ncbi:4-hydroxy-tetrahydrodipicolinate synthase [Paraliobacillus sp. PM-2]|uniref:4-hydroxy-tetrahydrodipicolinate synthase n=1 Tax=Paraliobacillus sp. PM-2 TaxID=1462524 RepID=UPI00061BE781|nr:4-hydroxy-tetrahydrodipicolinate synthase [Paraliobacillus sp. PM-2]CQR47563.1 4-hydroxy-tetrahydrodipicolinate synthase [Paraliobacillus sp. PM-2]